MTQLDYGQTILSWQALEHPEYQKGIKWYIIAGAVILTIVVYGVLSHALTMSIAFLLFAGVYFLIHRKESSVVDYALTTLGIKIGDKFYPYADIESFYVIYEPPSITTLNIIIAKSVVSDIAIQLGDTNPADVREVLVNRGIVEKKGEQESFSSIISRILKL